MYRQQCSRDLDSSGSSSSSSGASRSGGLLVGVASLKTSSSSSSRVDISRQLSGTGSSSSSISSISSSGSGSSNGGARSVYVSGFRIVEEADKSRHAEYRCVLVSSQYERWHRFSEIKRVACSPRLVESMPMASREAWDAVRACKAPKGRALDRAHLGRKCLAIENFLSSLLEDMELSALQVGSLLRQPAPRSPGACKVGRKKQWVPGAPSHISRGRSGLRISMR
ncbi:unnamed protein product [Scytosiphon promiscuus]